MFCTSLMLWSHTVPHMHLFVFWQREMCQKQFSSYHFFSHSQQAIAIILVNMSTSCKAWVWQGLSGSLTARARMTFPPVPCSAIMALRLDSACIHQSHSFSAQCTCSSPLRLISFSNIHLCASSSISDYLPVHLHMSPLLPCSLRLQARLDSLANPSLSTPLQLMKKGRVLTPHLRRFQELLLIMHAESRLWCLPCPS